MADVKVPRYSDDGQWWWNGSTWLPWSDAPEHRFWWLGFETTDGQRARQAREIKAPMQISTSHPLPAARTPAPPRTQPKAEDHRARSASKASPQFSADGRWWWDGTNWILVPAQQRSTSGQGLTGLPVTSKLQIHSNTGCLNILIWEWIWNLLVAIVIGIPEWIWQKLRSPDRSS